MAELTRYGRLTPMPVPELPVFAVHAGRSFVVTGASTGIGRATAELLAAEGARVVITELPHALPAAQEVADRLGGTAAGVHVVPMDLADPASIPEGVARSVGLLGRVDGWVNNAAIVRIRSAFDHTPADWQAQFDVNVFGTFEATRLIGEHLAGAGGGSVVNVASDSGKKGHPDMVAYNATKAAVINLTRSLAEEWAPLGISVNCVCPGGVDTPMLDQVADTFAGFTGGDRDDIFASMANEQLGRHVAPVEVARVISFLLSGAASAVRGQAINVDGGVLAS
ncbi:SDR family NAD(P)-dependent oxidoreductase [Herbiconiux daphne]|uniref:SDR family oxidoreductase n=1 Tax=Herbiconiux daphne TaxID=2970914 RepID=A0ABT2H337_9MICO|nr:SDR family oxidoreductase [Herbiconiux daphne]MCS5734356.1 SDR family oxidoreductase [Herbiconiux daphne]